MNSEFIDLKNKYRVIRIKKRLETKLKVNIEIDHTEVKVDGDELDVFLALEIIKAINAGFTFNNALLLTDENYDIEIINIKDFSRKSPSLVKSRIIGTQGKTLRTLTELSECLMKIKDNDVYIIGPAEKIKDAVTALKSLIRGSKQSNVYSYLERQKNKFIPDLGLKQ